MDHDPKPYATSACTSASYSQPASSRIHRFRKFVYLPIMGTHMRACIVLAALCAGCTVAQAGQSRLAETKLDIPYEQNAARLHEGFEKPLYLSGYFKVRSARTIQHLMHVQMSAPLIPVPRLGPNCGPNYVPLWPHIILHN